MTIAFSYLFFFVLLLVISVSFKSDKSPGSDGVLSSDEAAEDIESSGHLGETISLRRRCRSADPSGNARHSDSWRSPGTRSSRNLQPPSSTFTQRSQRTSSGGPSPSYRGSSPSLAVSAGEDRDDMRTLSTAGQRSVLPTPLVTQHNKHELIKNHGASLLNRSEVLDIVEPSFFPLHLHYLYFLIKML